MTHLSTYLPTFLPTYERGERRDYARGEKDETMRVGRKTRLYETRSRREARETYLPTYLPDYLPTYLSTKGEKDESRGEEMR